MGFLSSLFGGGGSSVASTATTTSSTTNQADNRVVLGNDAVQVAGRGTYLANSNNTSTTNVFGTDPGVVAIGQLNAQLLQAVNESQGDTVRFIAQMGADGITRQAAAATDLFATSSTAAEKAWGHTVDVAGALIDKLFDTAQGTVAGANAVASQAVASFEPTANKNSDAVKYAAIAVCVVAAMKFLK